MTEKKGYERMKGEIADLRCAIAGLIAENERLKEGRMHLTEIIARLLIQNFELMDECIPDWRYFAKGELELIRQQAEIGDDFY